MPSNNANTKKRKAVAYINTALDLLTRGNAPKNDDSKKAAEHLRLSKDYLKGVHSAPAPAPAPAPMPAPRSNVGRSPNYTPDGLSRMLYNGKTTQYRHYNPYFNESLNAEALGYLRYGGKARKTRKASKKSRSKSRKH